MGNKYLNEKKITYIEWVLEGLDENNIETIDIEKLKSKLKNIVKVINETSSHKI